MKTPNIEQFKDDEGRIKQWPSRKKKESQQLILEYLLEQFTIGTSYSEMEVNNLLNEFHTFKDPAMLRRELVVRKMLSRTIDCRNYWVTDSDKKEVFKLELES